MKTLDNYTQLKDNTKHKKVAKVSICGNDYNIIAVLKQTGVKFPNAKEDDKTKHNKFLVTVNHDDINISFDYYSSHMDYTSGKNYMDDSDLTTAFYHFLSDAQAGSESFNDFCSNFGYDEDSRTAYKIYEACEGATTKVALLSLDVYDALNEFQEKYEDFI